MNLEEETYPDDYSEYEFVGTLPGAPWVVYRDAKGEEEFGWGDLLDPNVVRDFVWEGPDDEDEETK